MVDAHPWVISAAPVFAMSSLEMLQMQQYCSPTRDLHGEVTPEGLAWMVLQLGDQRLFSLSPPTEQKGTQ